MCRFDPDFPYNPPRRPVRRDDDDDLMSVGTLLARHVPARRVHRDNPTRGAAR